jgi:hypothetical protein
LQESVEKYNEINDNYAALKTNYEKLKRKVIQEDILVKYTLSETQKDKIISSNKKVAQLEIKKREALEYIFSNKDFEIKSLELQNDLLVINFLNVDKQKIEDFISKKYKITSSNVQNLILNIKVQL